MADMKNLIVIEHDDTDVLVCFKPRCWSLEPQQRWINASDAWALGLLLTSEAPSQALRLDTEWLSVAVENSPYKIAGLSMTGIRGGQTRKLTACLKDGALARVGDALLEVSGALLLKRTPQRAIIRRSVSHFYMHRDRDISMAA